MVLVQLISQFFNRLIVVQLNSENKLTKVQTSRGIWECAVENRVAASSSCHFTNDDEDANKDR